MKTATSKYKVLALGFGGQILNSLRENFESIFSISNDDTADLNWDMLHLMRQQVSAPEISFEMMECMNSVMMSYARFSDINSRRFYYLNGRDSETYNSLILTFYILYKIITEKKINLILYQNIPHEGFDYVVYLISQHLRIKSVICHQSLFPNRFWLAQSIENFGKFKLNPKLFEVNYTDYELPKEWFYMRGSNLDFSYKLSDLILEVFSRPYRAVPAIIRYIYAQEYRSNVRKLTQKKTISERYIYFPLHLQPELTTSALGGVYADQALAIESLSAFLPDNLLIYVKENPKQTEKQRDKFFYKRLSSLKNVKLIDARENSINLIEGSLGVATITGTAGWEALFLGKPVLIFGFAWYREFGGVTKFQLPFDFNEFINNKPPDNRLLSRELSDKITTAGVGIVDSGHQLEIKNFDEKVNARSVAESICRYIQFIF